MLRHRVRPCLKDPDGCSRREAGSGLSSADDCDRQFMHYLMSTAPWRWARNVNFCPGVLSDTVDVEFIIHEGLQEGSDHQCHKRHSRQQCHSGEYAPGSLYINHTSADRPRVPGRT